MISLRFDRGTLVVPHVPEGDEVLGELVELDERTGVYRAPADRYRDVVMHLHTNKIPYEDEAKSFEPLNLSLATPIEPFPHQAEAIEAWFSGGRRGIVELPTGAGKTFVAVLAMLKVQRPTLVVVPTIDLLQQWQRVLSEKLGIEVGMLGGGAKDRRDVTITTYDSAAFQTEFHGNKFGFLICDECHHLPAPAYRFIASGSIAPFRLGLTATLERPDGEERTIEALLGPLCFSLPIDALEGRYLAPYDVVRVEVALTDEEQKRYDEARATYIDFLRGSRVNLSRPDGWAQFIMACQRSSEGREALAAYREQRRIAFTSDEKIAALWKVLRDHRAERTIVFTEDNDTVYRLSHQLLMPTITHQTKAPERKRLLAAFAEGDLSVLLTSRVLNEGVDVPDANIGVVLSGSGSVREHVQRLGRILRKRPGKRATLYEICSGQTAEAFVSERRRQHRAYQR